MTDTSIPAAPLPAEISVTPPLSQGARIVDTFIAPSKTFTDILRDRSWWLPFLLAALVGYGYLFAVQKQVGWDVVAQNVLKQDPKAAERLASAPADQQAQVLRITTASIKYTFFAGPVLILLVAAIASLVLWGTINFAFGGKANYSEVLAVWLYGMLPLLITSILTIVTLFAGMDKEAFNLNNPVGTNIGFYLGADIPQWLQKLTTAIDVIWLWALALVGIGLAIVGKVKRSSGLAAVFIWWLLIQVVKVAYAAITG